MGDGATSTAFLAVRSWITETHPPISAESPKAVKVDFEHGGSQGLKFFCIRSIQGVMSQKIHKAIA